MEREGQSDATPQARTAIAGARRCSRYEIGRYFQAASTKLKSKNFDSGGTCWLRSPH
jgi:hypothetical protein